VEVELVWFEALVEGAEDEATGLRGVVILHEVGEGAMGEALGTAFAIYVLVADEIEALGEVGF
jgi:hypothetical protein